MDGVIQFTCTDRSVSCAIRLVVGIWAPRLCVCTNDHFRPRSIVSDLQITNNVTIYVAIRSLGEVGGLPPREALIKVVHGTRRSLRLLGELEGHAPLDILHSVQDAVAVATIVQYGQAHPVGFPTLVVPARFPTCIGRVVSVHVLTIGPEHHSASRAIRHIRLAARVVEPRRRRADAGLSRSGVSSMHRTRHPDGCGGLKPTLQVRRLRAHQVLVLCKEVVEKAGHAAAGELGFVVEGEPGVLGNGTLVQCRQRRGCPRRGPLHRRRGVRAL
mmetsp:Transcript_94461/g.246492  ORF Transcript_94461/g.246492 Transcript_94461/m.246492 type:complete len:272 (+) Transcript_94461:552-1367(+)